MMRQQKCDAGGGADTSFQQTVALHDYSHVEQYS